jgi:ATP-binding cassette subfamily B protein
LARNRAVAAEEDSPQDPLAHLPEALREQMASPPAEGEVLLTAQLDLDAEGMYADSYLALTAQALGHFCAADGEWSAEWMPLADVAEARLVEGLGVNSLRLLRGGKVVQEFRFTLRHAREAARLHRRLEKLIEGEAAEKAPEPEPHHTEPKKLRCPKCGRVIPPWSDFCPACMSRRKVLSRVLDFVAPYRWQAAAGVALAVAVTGASLVQPYLTKPMIDDGLGGVRKGSSGDYRVLVMYVCILAGLVAATAVGRGVQQRLMARLAARVARDVRNRLYSHLQKLSLSFFSRKQTGSLVSRVTSDSDRLWDFIAFTVVELAVSILTLAGVAAFLIGMHWRLALLVLLPVPVMIGLMMFFHNKMHRIFDRLIHRWHQMTSVVAGALPGVRVIKAFSQERREIGRFEGKNLRVYDEERTLIGVFTLFGPLMMLCTQIGTIIVWLVGGWWVIRDQVRGVSGDQAFTAGTLMAFTGFMMMFYRPIHMLAHMDRMFNRAAASAQRIFEVLDTEPSIFSRTGAKPAERLRGEIEFRNVSFSYDGVRKVLNDVSFRIAPGEMIGLAGPSGGGKTTTINLICRFYDVLEGRILLDGVDVRDYDIEQLRQRIGVVLQEPFLFHGTVAENVAYGKPGASLEEIITAAKAANAHDFIVGFPDGYDTVVGERGHTLSGGELQRVSIARAILNNPAILILDEATSSVDTETEKLIQEAMDRLVAERTTIAIAHRLSTLRKANRLIVLEKGELKEQGTHEELAGKPDGIYAKLLRMQAEAQSLIAIA